MNPFLTDLLGYTHEEFIGKKLWEIGAFRDTAASKAALAELQHKGYVRYEDLPLTTKDGREVDVEFVSNTYIVNHHAVIQCNIRDITRRRRAEKELLRSEELFRAIARVSPVGLFRTERDGGFGYVNECWTEITGLSPDEASGEGWSKALHPGDRKKVLEQWNRAVLKGSPFKSEHRIQGQDGATKWVILNAVAERATDNGTIIGYVGTLTDITDRKRMEEDLQKTHEELERRVAERTAQLVESNDSLIKEIAQRTIIADNLAESRERLRNLTTHLQNVREQERASLSRELHDQLGQVLTALKMDIRWVENRLPNADGSVIKRLHSIVNLIDDSILSVQKISMALRPPALSDFGLSETLRLALTTFEKSMNIACRFTATPHRIVLDDDVSTAVFRIFQETLTNIARHAGAKTVTVLLHSTGDKLNMEISDDGRGITKKEIMDRNSIGLTGMRERAYAIMGHLTVLGVRGRGTTVTLTVPLNKGK